MRTITDAQEAVYGLAQNMRATWAKVEVYSAVSSSWVELTNYLGRNWVKSVELVENVDEPVSTASIELYLLGGQHGEVSASPLLTSGIFSWASGYNPVTQYGMQLVSLYKKVRVYLAVTPIDTQPESSDWQLQFRGYIDSIELSVNGLSLTCKNEMGYLADTWIERQIDYGSTGGTVLVEDVIQAIVTLWCGSFMGGQATLYSVNGTGGTPFNVSDSPGWAITAYPQQEMSVMDAVVRLADQIGYMLRFSWQTSTADFKLMLKEPSRSSPSSQRTFAASELLEFHASMSLADIRNVVTVKYSDKSDRRQYRSDEDAASIALYGRRVMVLAEEQGSQIDTSTEAEALRDAILSDLSTPEYTASVRIPLFISAELGDYYTLTGDGIMFDTMSVGVKSISHTIDAKGGFTSMSLSGLPASRVNWYKMQDTPIYRQTGVMDRIVTTMFSNNMIPNGDFGQWSKF